jgi:dephospho-CoA kinase
MVVVGLTGGLGAGKSVVASMLAARGAEVIDVDALGRLVLEPGEAAHDAVLAAFPGVAGPDGHIDRRALADIVFADRAALARLEAISHPAINGEIARRLEASPAQVVVLDMAALVGTRLGWLDGERPVYDVVVTVEAPADVRIARAVARGMRAEDAARRVASQPSEETRRALAQHVITNDGDLTALEAQVAALFTELCTAG